MQRSLFLLVILYLLVEQAASWCLKTVFASASQIKSLDFSPDNMYILSGQTSGKVILWRMDTLQIIKTYNFGAVVWEAVFSKDQRLIGVAGQQDNVHILNGSTLALISTLNTNHNSIVYDIDFRYDNQCLVTCGDDKKTKVWNTTNWNLITTNDNKHICFSLEYADNDWYVVAGQHYYETYDTNNNLNHQLHDGSISDFLGLRIRPGGQYFIAANYNGNLYSSDVNGTDVILTDASPSPLNSCGYSRDSSYFASAGANGKVYMYNATSRNNTLESLLPTNSTSAINASNFSPDSNYFAAGDQNGSIYLYYRFCHGCPVGTYPNMTGCRQCAEAMAGCAICINSYTCKSCMSGYYMGSGSKCSNCQSAMAGCADCNSSNVCQGCQPGFYLNGLTCSNCMAGQAGCYLCNSSSVCVECEHGHYLSGNSCLSCSVLNPHCVSCTNSSYCIECISGYYLQNGSCTICQSALSNCLVCQSATNCSVCRNGYRLNSSYTCDQCSPQCLFCNSTGHCFDCVQQMYVSASYTCQFCTHPCFACNSSSYCLSCLTNYYMSSPGTCTNCASGCLACNSSSYCTACDIGYYLQSHSCTKCSSNCRQCSSTSCYSCEASYTLYNSSTCHPCSDVVSNCKLCRNADCLECASQFYLFNNTCQLCSKGCAACSSSILCLTCLPTYYLLTGSCLLCSSNCLTCTSASPSACMSCLQGYYLAGVSSGTCNPCSSINNCLHCYNSSYCVTCAPSSFLWVNGSTSNCLACTYPCLTCASTSSACLTCALSYYLDSANSCRLCTQHCAQCTSFTLCTVCNLGYYISIVNSSVWSCSPCLAPCLACHNTTYCIQCASGYYQSVGTCLPCSSSLPNCLKCTSSLCFICEYGYTLNSSICVSCSALTGCEQCYNVTACETCMVGYFASVGSCIACGVGCEWCFNSTSCEACAITYLLSAARTCQLCQSIMVGCQLCSTNSTCTYCNVGFYLSLPSALCVPCQSSLQACINCYNASYCLECDVFSQLQLNASCVLCHQIYPNCQLCGNSSVGCLDCQVGHYMSLGSCINCAAMTNMGCLKCSSNVTCTQCKRGFYLASGNSSCGRCEVTYSNCIYCSQSLCWQCKPGFYLSSNSTVCLPCAQPGCEVCLNTNASKCVACNSYYYLTASANCALCNSIIPNCLECSSSTACTTCPTTYYLTPLYQCGLCSTLFPHCRLCTATACQDCNANFFLNSTDYRCYPCTYFLIGCAFCSSQATCLSCQTGYFLSNQTCHSCANLTGCLYCINETFCTLCEEEYYLEVSDNMCYRCADEIANCFTCSDNSTCTSCAGNYQLTAGQCVLIKPQVTKHYTSISLKSYYVNSTTLKHILFAKSFSFNPIDQNWTTEAALTIIDQYYTKYSLNILSVSFARTLDQIIFITDNPIANQLTSSSQSMPFSFSRLLIDDSSIIVSNKRFLASSVDLNFNLKLMLSEKASQQIMPDLQQIGDLYLSYPYNDPTFYRSIIQNYHFNYYIFGLVVILLIIVIYSAKLCILLPSSLDKGSIVPHVLAIKCGSLALYPTFGEYLNYCYGFMMLDLPWLNAVLGDKLGDSSDVIPDAFVFYFTNLSIVSTYLLASCVVIALWFTLTFLSYCAEQQKSKTIMSALKTFFYNLFVLGIIIAGCLALQGSITNSISVFSFNTVGYILGIVMYVSVFVELVYSWLLQKKNRNFRKINQQHQNLSSTHCLNKLRVFVKGTLLSLMHYRPLYILIAVICIDVTIVVVQYFISKDEKFTPKLELLQHIIANLALGCLILMPHVLLGIIICSSLILITLALDVYRAIRQYIDRKGLENLDIDIPGIKVGVKSLFPAGSSHDNAETKHGDFFRNKKSKQNKLQQLVEGESINSHYQISQ